MNEVFKSEKQNLDNKFEKIVEGDTKQLLKEYGDIDYLDNIPDDSEKELSSDVFPYGSSRTRPYNFNLKR